MKHQAYKKDVESDRQRSNNFHNEFYEIYWDISFWSTVWES